MTFSQYTLKSVTCQQGHLLLQGISKVWSNCKLYFVQALNFNASLGKCKLVQVGNLSK